MANEPENVEPVKKSLMFTGEYLFPGGSNLVQGDIKQAGVHAALGLVAKALFGVPGLIVVSANSFTKALTGRHLHEHLGLGPSAPEATSRPTPPSPVDKKAS